jgi:RNA recognition motif-containing protein
VLGGFSTDDRVDIVAKKNGGGREQAFVVFEEQTAATAALRGLSGQLFYKKALVRLSSSHLILWKEMTDS